MKKIYGTYRASYYNKGEGRYTPSYRLNQQYSDYKKAGLTHTLDMEIPEQNYTSEIAPGVKKETRFIIGEYNETYINVVDYKNNISNVGAEFQIEIFTTPADAIVWIKANTDLVEETAGKFLISPAGTGIDGKPTKAKYLIIN